MTVLNENVTIDNADLIICPQESKKYFLKYRAKNPLAAFKLLTKEQLIENVYFKIKPEATFFLYRQGKNFEECSDIISNLYFLNENAHSKKIEELKDILSLLKKANLIDYNQQFKTHYYRKNILVCDYESDDKELLNALHKLEANFSFENLKGNKKSNNIFYHEFEDLDQELLFVINRINKLVVEGVSLNEIGLYRLPSDYCYPLEKISRIASLPINFKTRYPLSATIDFNHSLNLLQESVETWLENETIPQEIKNFVIEKYVEIKDFDPSQSELQAYLRYCASKTYLETEQFKEAVSVIGNQPCKYNFILGFSLESFPHIYKDTEYLTDEEKSLLNRLNSEDKTNLEKKQILKFIQNSENIWITFSKKVGQKTAFPSLLVKDLSLQNTDIKDEYVRYSLKQMNLELASYLDQYFHYKIDHPSIELMDDRVSSYRTYSHKFKSSLNFENNHSMNISFTRIESYNKCAFSYFAERILKLNEDSETFSLKLGNLFHKVLELSEIQTIDTQQLTNLVNEYNFTVEELLWLKNLLPLLPIIIENNEDFKNHSAFKHILCEKNLNYQIDSNTFLTGKIDRISINEKEKELILTDYKTGSFTFNQDQVAYGFSLQLPLYLLLIETNYPDYETIGLYIKTILSSDFLYGQDLKFLKLNGLTLDDREVLQRLDDTYCNSEFIKNLKIIKSGAFDRCAKVISKETRDELKNETLKQLKKAVSCIRQGQFDINPKRINEGKLPCEYCQFSDLCFHDETDTVYIDTKKEENSQYGS